VLPALLASLALAQNAADIFSKAPPDVDEALRGRIAKFYQFQVDGKPRRAEELVAEESKDFFYSMNKPKFLSFEIRDIAYSENFTKAKAMVVVEMYLMMPGFDGKPMKVPGGSYWKVQNGLWCWYVDADILNTTPWGKMKSSDNAGSGGAVLPDLKSAPTPQTLARQVSPDKLTATLKVSEPSSDQITIQNQMPGTVKIELRHAHVPGLEVKADSTEIVSGKSAVVRFRYVPGKDAPPRSVLVEVAIEPTNAVIPLRLAFKQ
jgi:hypothetical protein